MVDSIYMETNTTDMVKQIAIWGGVLVVTALIITGMVYTTKRNSDKAANQIKNVAIEYAKKLNLNIDQFSSDFDSEELQKKLETKISEGHAIPITYTPTFFLNGTRIDNPRGYDEFKTIITETINGKPVPVASDGETKIPNTINSDDWIQGNKDSKIVLIEYSDFQCPACASYFPITKKLTEEFSDKIVFVYRHYPLVNIHPYAEPMARAAEAAGKQGKFWEMYELIFANQATWSR